MLIYFNVMLFMAALSSFTVPNGSSNLLQRFFLSSNSNVFSQNDAFYCLN